MLTGGCGSADSVPTGEVASETPRETPTHTPEPVATATPSGPLTTIPPEVRLPHEQSWEAGDPLRTDALPEMCIDPGPDLYPPDTTDRHAFYGTTADGTRRGESLALFSDARSARRAVEVWRLQTARCGHGLNHVGSPQDWVVRAVEIGGADEAWQSVDIGRPGPGQKDMSAYVPFTTAVRVGSAVYVETAFPVAEPDDAVVRALADAEVASVAAFVPTLSVFAS
jgi:hypothetical protein